MILQVIIPAAQAKTGSESPQVGVRYAHPNLHILVVRDLISRQD
jgi:hypothetical protein